MRKTREPLGDEPVFIATELRLHNPGQSPRNTSILLSIDFPADDTVRRETLESLGGHVFGAGVASTEQPDEYAHSKHRFWFDADGAATELTGDVTEQKTQLRATVILKPGETRRLQWRVPYQTIVRPDQWRDLSDVTFDKLLAREARRWRNLLALGARIQSPSPWLDDFDKAQLAHMLINIDRDARTGRYSTVLPPGDSTDRLIEMCRLAHSLDLRGMNGTAQSLLDTILIGQSDGSVSGRLADQRGVFTGAFCQDADGEGLLGHGYALWTMNEHYRLTHDRSWTNHNLSALIAACDFVERVRMEGATANLLGTSGIDAGAGLLPPARLTRTTSWGWWLVANAFAWKGMAATAQTLRELNHAEAERIRDAADAFEHDLRRTCQAAMLYAPVVRIHDGTYVPQQPVQSRSRDRLIGSPALGLFSAIQLVNCGVYEPDAVEADWILRDVE